MIVHFIGGPRHGETEALSGTFGNRLRIPYNYRAVPYRENYFPRAAVPYEIAEYELLYRERYVIAEFIEPSVKTNWRIEIKCDYYNVASMDNLSRWLFDRRDYRTTRDGITWLSVISPYTGRSELNLQVVVDGPADATAIKIGGEKIQKWLDSNLPDGVTVTACQGATA